MFRTSKYLILIIKIITRKETIVLLEQEMRD